MLRDELEACKAQAGAAAEEAAAKLAHQASAARARHNACMQEYTHSFSKQVRGLPVVLWCGGRLRVHGLRVRLAVADTKQWRSSAGALLGSAVKLVLA